MTMDLGDDFFDRIINEVPELDVQGHESFILRTSPTEAYIVQVDAITKRNPFNIFGVVVNYNNFPIFPLKVDFVSEKREAVEDFLNEHKIPWDEVLIKRHKL